MSHSLIIILIIFSVSSEVDWATVDQICTVFFSSLEATSAVVKAAYLAKQRPGIMLCLAQLWKTPKRRHANEVAKNNLPLFFSFSPTICSHENLKFIFKLNFILQQQRSLQKNWPTEKLEHNQNNVANLF